MHWLKYMLGFLVAALAIVACNPGQQAAAPKPEAPVVAAQAQPPADVDPAAYRGAAIAQQVCNQCHDIGLGSGPAVEIGAPPFRDIAGRRETTEQRVAGWMNGSHPVMPNYLFTEADVADLTAFIVSLRQTPQ